mgnify:CR=1 FL=1
MNPKFSWKIDTFDSDILGFSCAKIQCLSSGGLDISELITDLVKKKVKYAVIRIPGSDYQTAQLLERNSFRIVDSLVEMSLNLSGAIIESVENVRVAKVSDSEDIEKLSSDSFQDTRFFHDDGISKTSAKKIYSEWARNSLLGKAADKVIVWEQNGTIEGFATIQKSGHIPLIAVAKSAQGKGVGKALCRASINVCKEFGATNAAIETQTNNIPAMRAYISAGLKIINSYFTFSWHAKS